MREKIDLAILGATLPEVEPVTGVLRRRVELRILGERFWRGVLDSMSLVIGTVGFNKVNAAITTAALLERFSVSEVWLAGCAGAYAGGPLKVGDVLITERALCGDEGVLVDGDVLSSRAIGIPALIHEGQPIFEEIPLYGQPPMHRIRRKTPAGWYRMTGKGSPARFLFRSDEAAKIQLDEAPGDEGVFQLLYGPALTVGMASGDDHVAGRRFTRYGAFAENMEGSSVAQTCLRFGIPMLECRSMSNMAGDRRKEHWRMGEAIAHCHAVMLNWLSAE